MSSRFKTGWQLGLAIAVGAVIGVFGSWWINRPWLSFTSLEAHYVLGSTEITTDGQYYVRRVCATDDEQRVIWRYEAIATDGQIAIYGPKPPAPDFTAGEHRYTGSVPLLQKIRPDGWVVRVLITCPGETPETVASPPALVQVRG